MAKGSGKKMRRRGEGGTGGTGRGIGMERSAGKK